MINAIVASGSTHALGVVRGLGRRGVPVTVVSYDRRDIATSSRLVRDVIRAPHPDNDEAAFVKVLLEAAHRCPGSLLIPASDAALGSIARNRTTLEDAGLIVASDAAEVTEILLNKAKTFALARSAGVPGPATYAPVERGRCALVLRVHGVPCSAQAGAEPPLPRAGRREVDPGREP